MVSSKLNPRIYFWIFLILALMGLGFYFLLNPGPAQRNRLGGSNTGTLPGLILTIGMALILFWILWSIEWMSVDPDQIRIFAKLSRHNLNRGDIRSIRLWDEKGHISDGITIDTISDETYYLGDGVWRNGADMKQTLLELYAELIPRAAKPGPIHPPPEERAPRPAAPAPASAEPVKFSGFFLLSQNGILFLGVIAVIIWGITRIGSTPSSVNRWFYLLPAVPMLAILAFLGYNLFYFRINPESLEIRNHVMPWYSKVYLFIDIDSVSIEPAINRNSRSLYIKTIDFRTGNYGAGSLRRKDWLALAKNLRERNVPTKSRI
jgi:hypothetical protein